MPDLSAYVDFSVELDKSQDPPVILLTDTSNYPMGVPPLVTGVFSVTQPDGIAVVGNFTSPDVSWDGSALTTNTKELRLATDSNFQNGLYTITYTVHCTGYSDTVKTKTFNLAYIPVNPAIFEMIDVFTPQFLLTDSSIYTAAGFNTPTIVRSWSATIRYVGTSIGTVTGSALPFNMAYNTYCYDAQYSATLIVTLTFVSSIYSWLTIVDKLSASDVIDTYTPPTLSALRASLAAMKTEVENGTYCGNCGCGCATDYAPYVEAVALYDQIVARGQAGETIGLDSYVTQLEKIFNCSGLLTQTHTNSIITAYDFGTTGSAIGNNNFTCISFIANVTGMLGGATTYTIPLAINHGSIQVFNSGNLVPPQENSDDADLNWTATYTSTSATVSFWQSGVATAPMSGTRMVICYSIFSPVTASTGLSAIVVLVATTGNTLSVPQLAGRTFVQATQGATSYDINYISQSGIVLDFSTVGGVAAGQILTIFYQ